MIIGSKEFKNRTYVMAIINLTPDSFYPPSRTSRDKVLFAAERAVAQGASVIDIGAQSTRPGYTQIAAEEEIERFLRPLQLIKANIDAPVSVDTYFSQAAEAALSAGADMINDVWGLSYDKDMAKTIARHNASVCIMHNSATPVEGDVFPPVMEFLKNSANLALSVGIDANKICLDGGIGFAKSRSQNFDLINGYGRLGSLGFPTLLGCSRKSMFGGDVKDRLSCTLHATINACKMGVLFVRVHDVKANADAINFYYRGGFGRAEDKK